MSSPQGRSGYEPWSQQFQASCDHTSINATVKLIPSPLATARPPAAPTSPDTSTQGSVLRFQSHITDAETHLPVIADVRLNGETVRWAVTYLDLEVPLDEEDYFEIEVIAEGFKPWILKGRGKLKEVGTWQGPIWLAPESSDLRQPTPQTL